jgi:DNA processing protein
MDASVKPEVPPAERPTPTPELTALLTLKAVEGVGDRTVRRLVERFGTAQAALSASPASFAAVAGPAAAQSRADPEARRRATEALGRMDQAGLDVLTLHDPDFPIALEALHDPPALLFTAGRRELLNRLAVAIVGARRATEAGRSTAAGLAGHVARAGVTVVSGMALGIDAAAHRGALAAGGDTIAVLGSGADRPSPRTNVRLYRAIRERGLVLSEFPPGDRPRPHHFPKRNRLMAALARAVVVVEAAERSGALITVDHALDLGREVFAVPGSVVSRQSRGTNALIREGARILVEPEQLLEELGIGPSCLAPGSSAGPPHHLGTGVAGLWTALTESPTHVDQVADRAGVQVERALALLSTLELEGLAVQRPGMRFARAVPGARVS